MSDPLAETAEEEVEKEYVNPKTGERGGPRGPEPTRSAKRGAYCVSLRDDSDTMIGNEKAVSATSKLLLCVCGMVWHCTARVTQYEQCAASTCASARRSTTLLPLCTMQRVCLAPLVVVKVSV